MAITHFTIRDIKRDGRNIQFVADHRDGAANGPIVGSQTYKVPSAPTRAAQERLMADAVRADVVKETEVVGAAVLVTNGTTLDLTIPARPQLDLNIDDFQKKYDVRKKIMIAVDAGLIASNDTLVTTQLASTVAAFNLLPNNVKLEQL